MSYKTGFYKGRLGIGLDSSMGMGNGNPRYPLDINGDIRLTGDIINENGFSLLGNAVNGTFIISDASNVILSNVNANVGIGTTNPISKLSVYQGGITLDNPVATYTNASVAATANSLKPFEIRATTGSLAGDWGILRLRAGGGTYMSTCSFIDIVGFNSTDSTCIKFFTYNNERMRINSSGNVGIGTADPPVKFTVRSGGDAKMAILAGNDVNASAILYFGTQYQGNVNNAMKAAIIAEAQNHWGKSKLHFCLDNTGNNSATYNASLTNSRMTITQDGNVGIGITNPGQKLEVNGNINIEGTQISINPSTEESYTYFSGTNSIYTTFQGNKNLQLRASDGKIFFTAGTSGSSSDRMVIDTTGNVGIGTTSPEHKLQIAEVGSGDNTNLSDAIASIVSNSEPEYGKYGMYFGTHQTNGWSWIQTGRSGSASQSSATMGPQYNLCLQPNAGNVGIGTDSPDTKLHVNDGKLLITETYNGYSGGKILGGVSDNAHAIHFRVGEDGTTDVLDFHEYGKIRFYTNGLLAAQTEKMCILQNGNVGIGTTSPDTPLEIEASSSQFYGNLKCIHTNGSEWITMGYGGISTGTTHSLRFGVNGAEKMRIDNDGNVGIGVTDPGSKLQVEGRIGCGNWSSDGNTSAFCLQNDTNWGMKLVRPGLGTKYYTRIGWYKDGADNDRGVQFYDHRDNVVRMFINGEGLVGIGTTSPSKAKLQVEGTGPLQSNFVARYYNSSGAGNSSGSNRYFSAYFSGHIATQELQVFSDRRIKENIVDVSDNQALSMLRDIPCRYYEYRDKISKGDGKTIGFIAQEVKEVLPLAVSVMKDVIPNEMRNLENISWEEIIDGSNNKYKLTSDLSDCSGINYKFYVSNDPSGNDECKKEIIGNSDDTFTFEEKWNNVFCYGKEVDDFHTLDKQKLFALNFSATQELDRKVIVLENENAELKAELAAIKSHLGI